MRRFAPLAATLVVALAAAAPAASARAWPHHRPVRASATLDLCRTGADPMSRLAQFTGQMAAVPGTARMQMRFDLLARRDGGRHYHAVAGPGLGVWSSSADASVRLFRYHQQVANLTGPAAYRAQVRFRWLGAGGAVVRRATRLTAACRQPDTRPNLVPTGVRSEQQADGSVRYVVGVRNAGRGSAPAFDVALDVAGTPEPPRAAGALAPGASETLAFAGPACAPGSSLTVTVDPDGQVAESREDDDVLSVGCPAPSDGQ